MEDTINNSGELCQNNEACIIDWNKLRQWNDKEGNFATSLTHLGGLEGSIPPNKEDGSIYGAKFMPVTMHTPYYERMTTQTVNVPWLAQDMEKTFMNQTKVLDEPEIKAYRELKLSNVPQQMYENVEKTGETIEGFGENTQGLIFKILCVVFLIALIYFLMKEIN